MNNSIRWAALLLISLVLVVSGRTESQTVSREKGLATGQPGMNRYTQASPGETTPLERAYDIAPALIPHTIEGFTIMRSANMCLMCHAAGIAIGEGHVATKPPPSHYINEYSGKQEHDRVTGMRYNCVQCHVSQADVDSSQKGQEAIATERSQ